MSHIAPTLTAQALFERAFSHGRAPRSEAYKRGVLDCLLARVDGVSMARCPYAEGTAECDAYFAGVDEGRVLAPMSLPPVGFDGPVSMTM